MPIVALNSRFVRAARCLPAQSKVDFFDTELTGFMLEVRASGRKTYYQRYTDLLGQQRQFKIGPAETLTLEQARRKARSVLASAMLGPDPQTHRLQAREAPPLATFVRDRYLPHVQGYKRSWKLDELILRCHILPQLGQLPLSEMSTERIADVVRQMRIKGYAPTTINRVIVIIRYIFNLAWRWKVPGAPAENPTASLSLAPQVFRERYLTRAETKRLLAAIAVARQSG